MDKAGTAQTAKPRLQTAQRRAARWSDRVEGALRATNGNRKRAAVMLEITHVYLFRLLRTDLRHLAKKFPARRGRPSIDDEARAA